ncbi:MAG: PD-(D/E)XK nuclease family protein [Clostridia bacterium]|nr:PD-(D/E)XK nuclease family protein [Clostridia bacterium]
MKVVKVLTIADCIKQTALLAKRFSRQENLNCIIFSEDKITLNIESETARACGGGFLNIDVTTFKRYISSIIPFENVLSKESSVMLVRKIILKHKKELTCFSSSITRPNLALTLYELISQLESANVTYGDLNELIENNNDESALIKKIKDIAFIYQKYIECLNENGLKDSNNYFSLMPELVKNDETIKNSVIILSGFSTITEQRADAIKALTQCAKDVYAVLIDGENKDVYTGETCAKIKQIFEDFETEQIVNGNAEVLALSKYLFNPNVFKKDFNGVQTQNVKIIEYSSPIKEVENTAKLIKNSVINQGCRFSDSVVAVGNLKTYGSIIKRVFSEYGIPCYIDSQITLAEHPICSYIVNYLNFYRKGLTAKDFLKFTTSSIFCLDKDLTDRLYVYVSSHAFSRNALKRAIVIENEDALQIERLRLKAFEVASYLDGAKTANEIASAVLKMLDATDAFSNVLKLGENLKAIGEVKFASYNDKVKEKLLNVLEQIAFVLNGEKTSIIDFINIFNSGVVATAVGLIPLFNDAVYVGEMQDVKIKSAQNLYALGLNGDVPFVKSDTALLTDGDLYKLDDFKIIIEPKIKIVNKREKENVAIALMSFKNKLFASYSTASIGGEQAIKSDVINYLASIFNLNVISFSLKNNSSVLYEDAKNVCLDYTSTKPALKKIAKLSSAFKEGNPQSRLEVASFYNAIQNDGLTHLKDVADGLLTKTYEKDGVTSGMELCFNNGHVSATTLEKYFACPYANFSQNVLKLKEEITENIKSSDLGSLLHSVTEEYVKKIGDITDKASSDLIVEQICNTLFNDNLLLDYQDNLEHSHLFSRLVKEGKRVCYAIYNSIVNSSFKPYLLEASFNDFNKDFKAIKLNAKSGTYKIQGKVDRIDIFDNKIRVIDYKTGSINASDEYFYTGNKLQLYLYMNAFLTGDFEPAGAYYFPVHDSFSEEGKKNYVMLGKTVDSEDIINATDNNFSKNLDSEYVSLKMKKGGGLTATSQALSKDEMQSYLKYAVKISEKGVDEINSGFIKPSPYGSSCDYCPYGGMCGASEDSVEKRKVKKVNSLTIINAVNENSGKGEK